VSPDRPPPTKDPAGATASGGTAVPFDALSIAPIEPRHRAEIEAILRATGVFREDEVVVALEVLDAYFAHPGQDYTTLGAFTPGGDLLGYVLRPHAVHPRHLGSLLDRRRAGRTKPRGRYPSSPGG